MRSRMVFVLLMVWGTIFELSAERAWASIIITFQDNNEPPTIDIAGTDPEVTVVGSGCHATASGEECFVHMQNSNGHVLSSPRPNVLILETAGSQIVSDQLITTLGTFVGEAFVFFESYDANHSAQACAADPGQTCTTLVETGAIQDLPSLTWHTDFGTISATVALKFQSDFDPGQTSAVPEPSSLVLLGAAALLGVGSSLLRRRGASWQI